MAFTPIFIDSFDHYNDLSLKYVGVGAGSTINTGGVVSRTGLGCLECGGVGGPQQAVGLQRAWVCGHAVMMPATLTGRIMIFYSVAAGQEVIDLNTNSDGSISFVTTNSHNVQGTTIPGLLAVGVYAYLETACFFSGSGSAQTLSAFLRVNGVLRLAVLNIPYDASVVSSMDLLQPSGTFNDQIAFHDDLYYGSSDQFSPSIVNDFQGAVRIYPYIPSANKTPLNWTPLANTNWQETSQIPPPGDTSYVSTGNIGDIDQYQLSPIAGHGPLGAFTCPFAQVVMDARNDAAGTGVIAPDIGGNVSSNQAALSTSYRMYYTDYLINPVTGLPFVSTDFASTFFGPKRVG